MTGPLTSLYYRKESVYMYVFYISLEAFIKLTPPLVGAKMGKTGSVMLNLEHFGHAMRLELLNFEYSELLRSVQGQGGAA